MLTQLRQDGKSFGLIAEIIGMTKRACIGKAHRLALPAVETKESIAWTYRPPSYRTRRSQPTAPNSDPIPFEDRPFGKRCGAPLWGPLVKTGMVCGAPVPSGERSTMSREYCDFHANRFTRTG